MAFSIESGVVTKILLGYIVNFFRLSVVLKLIGSKDDIFSISSPKNGFLSYVTIAWEKINNISFYSKGSSFKIII